MFKSYFLICEMRNLGCMISQAPLSSVTSVVFLIPWCTYWLATGLGQRIICLKGGRAGFVILPESLGVAFGLEGSAGASGRNEMTTVIHSTNTEYLIGLLYCKNIQHVGSKHKVAGHQEMVSIRSLNE